MDARLAFYLVPERPPAGMMYGLIAFAERSAAEMARDSMTGLIATFAALLEGPGQ